MAMPRYKGEKERWAKLIDGYFRSGRNIGLVFQLVDIRHKPSQDDLQMIDFLIENEFPFVLILTKKDKLTRHSWQSVWKHSRPRFPVRIRLP